MQRVPVMPARSVGPVARRDCLRALLAGPVAAVAPRAAPLVAVCGSSTAFGANGTEAGFDPTHAAWNALLRRHVRVLRGGQASQVDYAGFAADRAALKGYLDSLSAVRAATFTGWPKDERQAFLVNAYNAFTIELVLGRYPGLKSIKDLGTLLASPWKPKWIPLLGSQLSLDDIEHGMLRRRGDYDDPRVHFAANCASVGCPALREEAYVAAKLDAQLDEQAQRFMADRSRNRFDGSRDRLVLSKIFDWYREDFELGHRGIRTVAGFAGRYADVLADAPADRDRIRRGAVAFVYGDYDWTLNDTR